MTISNRTPRIAKRGDIVHRANYCSICWNGTDKNQGAAWFTASTPERLLAFVYDDLAMRARVENLIKRINARSAAA